ncbi:MAG TPA: hypothetical protein HPP84_09935 [Rhodospirillaceae bacterium]|nr:hypothetical protein [Rhodospirillaceae bacterium]
MNVFLGAYREVLEVAAATVGVDLVIVEDKETSADCVQFSEERGVRLKKLRRGEDLAESFPEKVDLAVIMGFTRLLKEPLIRRCGTVVNFHPGIVEVNRGRHGLLTAALKGHGMMGVTCHLIDSEEIDAGPIIAQVRLPIDYGRDFDANHARLRKTLKPLARLVLEEYRERGTVTALLWTPDADSYHPPLSPDELRRVLEAPSLGAVRER